MNTASSLRGDLLTWTARDDAEAQAWLDSHAAGYFDSSPSSSLTSVPDDACVLDLLHVVRQQELAQGKQYNGKELVHRLFTREGIVCDAPRLEKLDQETGELVTVQGCGKSSCQWCACTHAIRLVNAIMMSEPDYCFTLTLVGDDADETKKNVGKVLATIRKRHPSFRYIYRVEINVVGGLAHVHGFAHCDTTVTLKEFAQAANAAGVGTELKFERIPGEITGRRDFGAASYFAYIYKAAADPELFQATRELNRNGSQYPISHGRRFFRNSRDGETLTKRDAFKESWRQRREGYDTPKPIYRKSADDVGDRTPGNAPISAQEPSEEPQTPVMSSRPLEPLAGRTARVFTRGLKRLFNEPIRALKMFVSGGLIARSRGP